MAVFVATFDQTVTTGASQVYSLGSNDDLFVSRDATLITTGLDSVVIRGAGGHNLNINGELFSAGAAILTTGGFNHLKIGSTGVITASDSDDAVRLIGASNTIYNEGALTGDDNGINIFGNFSSITNLGTIHGRSGEAVEIDGSGNLVVNHGSISASNNDGLYINGGGNVIRNYGLISGVNEDGVHVEGLAGQVNNILNAGTISTTSSASSYFAVRLGAADDTLVNTGRIAGAVNLGGGADTFDSRNGQLLGEVLGEFGNDLIYGSDADDQISGGENDDVLYGRLGDDRLSGGAGDDTLVGGLGLDELIGGDGLDVASYANATTRVTASLESPSLNTGAAAGDSYQLVEGLRGTNFADTLTGDAGANQLFGGVGADILRGGAGNDTLYGERGGDRMEGGTGDDFYIVENAADVVVELSGAGSDAVFAQVNYTLPLAAVVERLEALSGVISITGNGFAQTLVGNTGDNVLNGRGGSDTLQGDDGLDVFVFNTALGTGNVDIISDFAPTDDTIHLENAIFTALTAGALAAGAFRSGTQATEADDRIIYDPNTGGLFYDRDGQGGAFKVRFATLDPGLTLTADDFVVI